VTKYRFAATSLLFVGLAYGLFGGPRPAFAFVAAQDLPRAVVSSSGRVRYVFKNAISCAPFQAMPVWAPGPPSASPLGYRCYNNPNGQ